MAEVTESRAQHRRGDLHTKITVRSGNVVSHVYALGSVKDPHKQEQHAKKSGLKNPEVVKAREVYLRENDPRHPSQTGHTILGAHGRPGGHAGHGHTGVGGI